MAANVTASIAATSTTVAVVDGMNNVLLDMTDPTVSLPLFCKQFQVQNLVQLKHIFTKMGEFTDWQIIEATLERFSLVKMKLIPSPQVIASLQIYPNFEYNVNIGDHRINLRNLGVPYCSHVCCVNDLILILTTINSLNFCEGNLCEDFPEVVVHNGGKFYGTDRKFFF